MTTTSLDALHRVEQAIAAERAQLGLMGYPLVDRARPLNQRVGPLANVTMRRGVPNSARQTLILVALLLLCASCQIHDGPSNARRERIIVHRGFDRDDEPNYTLHEIDPTRMVELRHTCVNLDSPGVLLEQVDSSFLFLASAPNTPQAHFRLTTTFALEQSNDGPPLPNTPLGPVSPNDSDPTRTFGELPGMFPVSAAVQSRDRRFVYYSTKSTDEGRWFVRIVRFDTHEGRIRGELQLENVGCREEEDDSLERVHYLFIDDRGRLIAFAGSDIIYMDHDHVVE